MLMRITYGVKPAQADDKYFRAMQKIVHIAAAISTPGKFPVEALPVLRYIPSWFPGGRYKKYAAECRRFVEDSLSELHKTVSDGSVSTPLYRSAHRICPAEASTSRRMLRLGKIPLHLIFSRTIASTTSRKRESLTKRSSSRMCR